jgi:hypothetical protein
MMLIADSVVEGAWAAVEELPSLGGIVGDGLVGAGHHGLHETTIDVLEPSDGETCGEDIESVLVIEVFDRAE